MRITSLFRAVGSTAAASAALIAGATVGSAGCRRPPDCPGLGCPTDSGPDAPVCGDGIVEPPEECDPPNGAGCAPDCTTQPYCGDGNVDPGEACDPPDGTLCDASCLDIPPPGPVCGNDVVEPPEECDPPDGTLCNASCLDIPPPVSVCGNGAVEPPEECDPPDGVTCSVACTLLGGPVCGNAIVEIGETCDPPGTACGAGASCTATCSCMGSGTPATPGAACTADSDCSAGAGGLSVTCLDETTDGWPGGFCLISGCTVNPMTGTDDCPASSHCESRFDGMGGIINECLPDCTPSVTGIGGCRTDTTAEAAYACSPDMVTPGAGYCYLGCETNAGCNLCDAPTGTCARDPATACATASDCLVTPLAWACNTTLNLCYPDHLAGSASIGDPCTDDLDCPANALCEVDAALYPGGYCTQYGCEDYASIPELACPAGSVCPATAGFFGGLLQICAAACTVDPTGDNTTECDTNRGDAYDYVCMETTTPAMSLGELCDSAAPGFCFQWAGLFGSMTGTDCQ